MQHARIERAGGDGVLHIMHAVGDVIGQVHHLAFDGTAGGVGRVLFEPGEHVRIIRIDAEFRTALPFRMRGGFGKRPRVFDGRIERGTRQIHACGTSVGKQYFRSRRVNNRKVCALPSKPPILPAISARRTFPIMAERRVAEVVRKAGAVDHVGIATERSADLSTDLRDLPTCV